MYKYGDYSGYINSLKNNKTYNGNYLNRFKCCSKSCPPIPVCLPSNYGFNHFYTDKGTDCKTIIITYEKRVTYIEPPLDASSTQVIDRFYLLQANNSIPNGTFKTIVNNINLTNGSKIILATEKPGGFTVFNKNYSEYAFVYGGEDLELLWNSSWNNGIGAWIVVKYSGAFK